MSLPTPYYQRGPVTLFHGDCLELLPHLPRVDAVVTSPPYDELREYGESFHWDFEGTARGLWDAVCDGGVVVWIVNDETKDGSKTGTSFKQALFFKDIGFRIHDVMIWNKGCFTAVGSVRTRYGPATEYMMIFSKGKPRAFNPICDRPNIHAGTIGKADTVRLPSGDMLEKRHAGKVMGSNGIRFNVWNVSPEMSNIRRRHPAQFPEKLAADHCVSWSNEGDTILDPFTGSGTTAIACIRTGRQCIGIELEEKYCEIAAKRCDRELDQKRLPFDAPKRTETQRALFAEVTT